MSETIIQSNDKNNENAKDFNNPKRFHAHPSWMILGMKFFAILLNLFLLLDEKIVCLFQIFTPRAKFFATNIYIATINQFLL